MTASCATEASKRGRANRNKGATFEREVSKWLREHGFGGAERGVRNGWRTDEHVSADPYDIVGTPGLLWSLKNTDVSTAALYRFLAEVHSEATSRGLVGLLVEKRRGCADIGMSWAWRVVYVEGVKLLPVRMTLAEAVDVLHAQGFGDRALEETG